MENTFSVPPTRSPKGYLSSKSTIARWRRWLIVRTIGMRRRCAWAHPIHQDCWLFSVSKNSEATIALPVCCLVSQWEKHYTCHLPSAPHLTLQQKGLAAGVCRRGRRKHSLQCGTDLNLPWEDKLGWAQCSQWLTCVLEAVITIVYTFFCQKGTSLPASPRGRTLQSEISHNLY